MADSSEAFGAPAADKAGDVAMGGEDVVIEIGSTAPAGEEDALPFAEETIDVPPRTTYIDYLKSPIITLVVGQGEDRAVLTAHQALLVTSPWFAEQCEKFADGIAVRRASYLK